MSFILREALQNVGDENEIQFPSAITINRDSSTGYITYNITDLSIHNLNPRLLKRCRI